MDIFVIVYRVLKYNLIIRVLKPKSTLEIPHTYTHIHRIHTNKFTYKTNKSPKESKYK